MTDTKEVKVRTNFSLSTTLTIIFVIAKIAKLINWSWWLVFLPTLLELALVVLVLIGAIIIGCIKAKH